MPYTHLTERERYVISHLHLGGWSIRRIARRIRRHHSTVSRELKRNSPEYNRSIYWYVWAHPCALARRHQPRCYRRYSNKDVVRYVQSKLRIQWSPEEIAQRIRIDYPGDEAMRISHETIYRWIYREARSGGRLYVNLRRRRKKRRRQKRYGTGRRFMDGRKRIAERPEIVEARKRFGDWEGDTIEGKKISGYIATMLERKSRYLVAAKLENKRAETLTGKTVQAFRHIPKKMRQTLTVDNGTEFTRFRDLERETGFLIYFADPYASWQRGANEHINGLLRQYFPKGTDFRKISKRELTTAVRKLNNRPRKCLHYQTPSEVFWNAARGALAI